MLRLVSDHNFTEILTRRLQREIPKLDLVRVRDVGLARATDEEILEWAAREGRILLTHDLRTVPKFAYERIVKGLPVTGVFAVPADAPQDQVFADLVLLVQCSTDGEWENRVVYLPL